MEAAELAPVIYEPSVVVSVSSRYIDGPEPSILKIPVEGLYVKLVSVSIP